MQGQFKGHSVREAVRKAIRGDVTSIDDQRNALSTKRIAEAMAPPLVWSRWYKVKEIWTPKDRELHLNVRFMAVTGRITFDIEIAHGHNRQVLARTIGPGSARISLPRNMVTAIYARCRSHTSLSPIDIRL